MLRAKTMYELIHCVDSGADCSRLTSGAGADQLRALMDAAREISQTNDTLEVVSRALHAVQSTVSAEKYTLGVLNEKKDAVELYSNPPVDLPDQSYMEEGSLLVDSTTTFGRVVLVCSRLLFVLHFGRISLWLWSVVDWQTARGDRREQLKHVRAV